MRHRAAAVLLALACAATIGASEPSRHAVLRFRGDLDTAHAADRFADAVRELERAGAGLIVLELSGNRSRSDLLTEAIDVITGAGTETAVFLSDRDDRRVGPGQLALALAADRASIEPSCRVRRDPADGLEHLNPSIADWAVTSLDLRARAKAIAGVRGLPASWMEALVAPRSNAWLVRADDGSPALADVAGTAGEPVVTRSPEGWTFMLGARDAASLYGLGVHGSGRSFARAAGARGRAVLELEVVSDLEGDHGRCLALVRDVRSAIELADGALDLYATRRGRAAILPRDYHEAADRAAALVEQSRGAIGEIAELTDRIPEILELPPPEDARTPTEIGGPRRSRLSSWRDAIGDAERELSYLDERIADYRRR
jgi:hypothetical protein